jgi:hypothetical protein
MLALVATDADAQRRRTSRRAAKPTTTTAAPEKPAITVDTTAIPPAPAEVPVVAIDSPKTDSSTLEKVADVVHDSVKAQLKAPIVQVPIRLKTLIVPGVLFAYGVVTLNNTGLRVVNEQARDWAWDGKNKYAHPYPEDYMLLAPAVAVYGMNIFGLKGQNNLIDRSVIYGMSNLIANGFVFGLKYLGIQQRPDSTDNYSFASGHTSEAFVSAEFLHQEYKGRVHWTVTAAGYACATTVAYLRMYHNKHWLSDVVAGAGIGMASTRFSYYLYPLLKHVIFGSKKVKEQAMIMPMYRPGGGYGLGFVYGF